MRTWDQRDQSSWKTDLFSNSLSTMINAVIRIMVHIRVCDEDVESVREGTLRVRPLPSYLPGHLSEMFGISPHTMNKDLSTGILAYREIVSMELWHSPANEHRLSLWKRAKQRRRKMHHVAAGPTVDIGGRKETHRTSGRSVDHRFVCVSPSATGCADIGI